MKEALYFLAILPPKEIRDEVWEFKELAFEKFETKASLNSPAHITLHMPFKWKIKKEELLLSKLSEFSFGNFPFQVELNGFDFFSPRVIFINVGENSHLENLQKELSKYIRLELNIFNSDYKSRPYHPHMTIAFRDLKKSIFPLAEDYFSKKPYQANFSANQFSLLKHNGKEWEEFQKYSL